MASWVYRLFAADGALLYVGVTDHLLDYGPLTLDADEYLADDEAPPPPPPPRDPNRSRPTLRSVR